MPIKHSINGIHAQRLKAIRPFINFNYDLRKPLSHYQKRKIKTYFDEVQALTARPNQVYRPRNKSRLKKAQQFAQHEKHLPGLIVAFIPNDGNRVRLDFDKQGNIAAHSKHVTSKVIDLDPRLLIADPAGYVESVIANRKEDSYTVLCGRYEMNVGLNKVTLPPFIVTLTNKYGNEGKNNYFGNWLHGIAAHSFKDQVDFGRYLADKAKAKRALQRKRRNKRQRDKRKQS